MIGLRRRRLTAKPLLGILTMAAVLAGTFAARTGVQTALEGSDRGYFVASPTSDPTVFLTQNFSNGEATYLGSYTRVARELVHLGTLAVTNGSFTIEAAKADTIFGTYDGQAGFSAEPGVLRFEVSGPVTGGSGRFVGATGRLTFAGVADLATGEFSETVLGTLSTPGSGAHDARA